MVISSQPLSTTAILTFLPTTHSTMTSNANTTETNNISNPTTCNIGPTTTIFGVYQQNLFEWSEISFHTLVYDAISAESYHKALITKLFFHQILPLSNNPSVFFSDLMTIDSYYFCIWVHFQRFPHFKSAGYLPFTMFWETYFGPGSPYSSCRYHFLYLLFYRFRY